MNQEEIKRLLKMYEQGLTSSEEEAILLKSLGNSRDEKYVWFKFLKYHKRTAHANLESQIWSSIQKKERKNPTLIFRALAVAASITLILTILWFPNPLKLKEMSYEEKAKVLKEALAMFSSLEDTKSAHEVIYEDDLLIIYSQK